MPPDLGTGRAVHRLQLCLEVLVEELVAMVAEEREQLAASSQPSQQELLLLREPRARAPALDRHATEEITPARRCRSSSEAIEIPPDSN